MKKNPQTIIKQHVAWAAGAGAVPVPLVDLAAVTGIQLDMLKQLSSAYGVAYSEEQGKSWLSSLSASFAARLGANALKLIPGIGSMIGGVSMSVMSGASTYALGQVAVRHFERNGTFSDLDIDEAREQYERAYEEGRKVAAEVRVDSGANPGSPESDIIGSLERLAALHQSGALTEAEFSSQKARLLADQ